MSAAARLAFTCLASGFLCACTPAGGAAGKPSPSPTAVHEAALPDFNSRLGSNRLAAEAAAALGRKLYAGGQYWEVYIRTQPASLPVTYDPGNPGAASGAASRVTSAEVVIATESAAAIKVFSQGGDGHERAVLGELDAVLRAHFPALSAETIRIYYGESFQHGLATFDHGRLVTYDVRRTS